MVLMQVQYEAPGWGVGELWLEDEMPVWHELPRPLETANKVRPASRVPGTGPANPVQRTPIPSRAASTVPGTATAIAERLRAYFAGEPDDFADVEIELEDATPFQQALTEALRAIPRGEVVAYGELAALAGRPGAARAAGTFCARNRLPIIVPCHRVVSSDGLGSYGSLGLPYKRRLLELEGAAL